MTSNEHPVGKVGAPTKKMQTFRTLQEAISICKFRMRNGSAGVGRIIRRGKECNGDTNKRMQQ